MLVRCLCIWEGLLTSPHPYVVLIDPDCDYHRTHPPKEKPC